jgi:Putative transposase
VAISNNRLIAHDERAVTFRWKDCREKGRTRYKTITLEAEEFMRRFLLHVLPSGFHRIRHYGLLGNAHRASNLATARALLNAPPATPAAASTKAGASASSPPAFLCRQCGAPMTILCTLAPLPRIRAPPGSPCFT